MILDNEICVYKHILYKTNQALTSFKSNSTSWISSSVVSLSTSWEKNHINFGLC